MVRVYVVSLGGIMDFMGCKREEFGISITVMWASCGMGVGVFEFGKKI